MADDQLWTILRVLRWTEGRFAERGIGTPRLDAEVLLAFVLGRERVHLYTHFDQPLGPVELGRFRELIQRRLAGEPVAYLIGEREFRSLSLRVDPRVLIPRPDTETLVEAVLEVLPAAGEGAAPVIVDVGVGSGAVALAIKAARPDARLVGIDASADALEVARDNAVRLGIDVELQLGDLLAPPRGLGLVDVVVSNPPYIPSADIDTLSREVRCEPRAALDGGPTGLELPGRLVREAAEALREGGWLAVEHGAGQAEAMSAIVAATGCFDPVERLRDLAGTERVVRARRRAVAPR